MLDSTSFDEISQWRHLNGAVEKSPLELPKARLFQVPLSLSPFPGPNQQKKYTATKAKGCCNMNHTRG